MPQFISIKTFKYQFQPMKKIITSVLFLAISSYAYSQCYADRHNTSTAQSWLSCQKSVGPNPARGNTHWIMYDFGDAYKLGKSTFWNLNNPDQINSGIRDAYVDYSMDGVNWNNWGLMHLERADASGFYEGEDGPDFEDLEARYLLITVIDNYGNVACSGFAEMRVETNGLATSTEDQLLFSLDMKVSPNPASSTAIVEIKVEKAANGLLEISDLSGKKILTQQANLVSGTNRISLDVSALSAGQYLVHYTSDARTQSVNLSVVHDN
jgi:hypothetical protein